MKLQIVFFVVLFAFFVAEACSPNPSGGGSSTPVMSSSSGASSSSSVSSTTLSSTTSSDKPKPEDVKSRKRRETNDIYGVFEDDVTTIVYTNFTFGSDDTNAKNAEFVMKNVANVVGETDSYVKKSLKNANGKLAIVEDTNGDNFCDVAAVVGYTVTRRVQEIDGVDVACNGNFIATFKKH
ncbi:hypothetical protein L596_028944 [Steinernema carpocapsae]|uniref:Uncharacterized protein n=1 Tax=Steinernema carpocapsae TaxID=34508 RepID=A0A4U5LZV2_STECR|nr:hypothetical protein L596_028944 [Steinernema carpocapsae]